MNEQEKLQAIQNRNSSYDGKFIFGVKTTKIICRPGCPARLPLEKNIVFFGTMEEAIEKGYRPCKRCKPKLVNQSQEGKLLSMSVWENEECVSKWRNFAAHRMAQEHGRMNDFADYKITVVTPVRSYTMMNRTEAPADSNEYLEV